MSRADWIRPKVMFAGFMAGLMTCALLGHVLSRRVHFNDYVRFYSAIQPQLQYYPSPFEIINSIETRLIPDRILVIVGGSSIFRGVGQNMSDLWTKRLQDNLGDRFQVFNVAIDQQTMEGFGSVVFRIIRERHPRTIYLGLSSTEQVGPMDGIPAYRYFFWDAFYAGLLRLDEHDQAVASKLRQAELESVDGQNLHVASVLESILGFRVIFNELAYRHFFPTFVANTGQSWYTPRQDYVDVDSDWSAIQKQVRNDVDQHRLIETVLARCARRSERKPIAPNSLTSHQALSSALDAAFSPNLRPFIATVLTMPNPEYLKGLEPGDLALLMKHYDQTLAIHRNLGFRTQFVGQDFVPDDFVDHGHFTASGGRKLADAVMPEILDAARDLQFLQD